jgi:DNA processing protein
VDRQRAAYVALALTPGIGPSRIQAILEVCHTAIGAFSAPFALLRTIPGVSAAAASAIAAGSVAAGVRVLEETGRIGGRALIPDDPQYPALLRVVPDAPPVLFALGNLTLLESPAVAIVGSRNHSPYGGEVARALAWGAAASGLVVVSGMARGLDAVAHAAALDAGGGTIGVLGNGLGIIYPSANRELYRRVAAGGLLLSEFPPGERPTAGSFPRRNRLISGLARVTVVIEAAEGSGALITAGTGLDQGREVMVVPGNITTPQSVGANRLIRDGAAPLLGLEDLLVHYPEAIRTAPYPGALPTPPRALPEGIGEGGRAIADLLGPIPIQLDDLAGRSGRPPQELLAELCALEIAGVVAQGPGRMFRRL